MQNFKKIRFIKRYLKDEMLNLSNFTHVGENLLSDDLIFITESQSQSFWNFEYWKLLVILQFQHVRQRESLDVQILEFNWTAVKMRWKSVTGLGGCTCTTNPRTLSSTWFRLQRDFTIPHSLKHSAEEAAAALVASRDSSFFLSKSEHTSGSFLCLHDSNL